MIRKSMLVRAALAARATATATATAATGGVRRSYVTQDRLGNYGSKQFRYEGVPGVPHGGEYGTNVFHYEDHMAPPMLAEFKDLLKTEEPISMELMDTIAAKLLCWCQANEVTHFTHFFQPLNGGMGTKHDAFIEPDWTGGPGKAIEQFRGKDLMINEPDGSSFPSGGLRVTSEARSNVIWDPSVPLFFRDHGNGRTLYIPCAFVAWTGEALDYKLPLLRSIDALEREVLAMLRAAGDDSHTLVHADTGWEQEFFIIDAEYYRARPDLQACGRTLFGHRGYKGQELDDQYFAPPSERIVSCIHDAEKEMWRLGVPMKTRHREVAPGQYEMCPVFHDVNRAADTNLLFQNVMRDIATRHDLAYLRHEKPFAGVNGSGKHNNWSFGTDNVGTMFDPTAEHFNLNLACFVRACDEHGDLIRGAIASSGNDHRLGANEAPPAIMSVYLGSDLHALVDCIIEGGDVAALKDEGKVIDLRSKRLPQYKRPSTDRNRTSPIAFTGNKFEVRAVGSSHNMSASNVVINSIVAATAKELTAEITALRDAGATPEDAVAAVVKDTLTKHQRVLFKGDGYSAEWQVEAAARGLPNIKTTPEALRVFTTDKNVALMDSVGVLSRTELAARQEVWFDMYVKELSNEATTMIKIANTHLVPASVKYIASARAAGTGELADEVGEGVDRLRTATAGLSKSYEAVSKLVNEGELYGAADACVADGGLAVHMAAVRQAGDDLEAIVDASAWPLPTYQEMLFNFH